MLWKLVSIDRQTSENKHIKYVSIYICMYVYIYMDGVQQNTQIVVFSSVVVGRKGNKTHQKWQ